MRLHPAWGAAFEEAWQAYREGSVPVGAVFVAASGDVVHRGRNQVYSTRTPGRQFSHTRLAHAEMNVLAQAAPEERLYEGILYTTLEPCPMCLGAALVCGVRHIRYAANDGPTEAARLLAAHPHLASKNMVLEGPAACLGSVSLVLMSDWILREASPSAERTLDGYMRQQPAAVDLARRWHASRRLQRMAQDGVPVADLLAAVQKAIEA